MCEQKQTHKNPIERKNNAVSKCPPQNCFVTDSAFQTSAEKNDVWSLLWVVLLLLFVRLLFIFFLICLTIKYFSSYIYNCTIKKNMKDILISYLWHDASFYEEALLSGNEKLSLKTGLDSANIHASALHQ